MSYPVFFVWPMVWLRVAHPKGAAAAAGPARLLLHYRAFLAKRAGLRAAQPLPAPVLLGSAALTSSQGGGRSAAPAACKPRIPAGAAAGRVPPHAPGEKTSQLRAGRPLLDSVLKTRAASPRYSFRLSERL